MIRGNPRTLAREWFELMPAGKTFSNNEMYAYLTKHFPKECTSRGDAAHKPRYRNDARWAIQGAKRDGLVRDLSIGIHERLAPHA
jgi:hypothetical protein